MSSFYCIRECLKGAKGQEIKHWCEKIAPISGCSSCASLIYEKYWETSCEGMYPPNPSTTYQFKVIGEGCEVTSIHLVRDTTVSSNGESMSGSEIKEFCEKYRFDKSDPRYVVASSLHELYFSGNTNHIRPFREVYFFIEKGKGSSNPYHLVRDLSKSPIPK